MYEHIIVAVDESPTSSLVLHEAIRFVKEHPKSFLRIIHVVDKNVSYLGAHPLITPLALQKAIKKAGIALLQKVESELRAEHISSFETKLIEINTVGYKIAEVIIEEAKAWPADVIFIGTHGRQGFHRFFLGSVAEGVTRIATVPVILIRGKS